MYDRTQVERLNEFSLSKLVVDELRDNRLPGEATQFSTVKLQMDVRKASNTKQLPLSW